MGSALITDQTNTLTELGFVKLSPGFSLYTPDKALISQDSPQSPTLICICSWAFAQPKHIAKYVKPYQELYQGASILLIQNIIANSMWKPDTWQMNYFQPGAAAIQSHLTSQQHPRVLLHTFSNGGSHAAVQLSQACLETCGGMRMPVDAIIFDSCPAPPRFAPTIKALVSGIPSQNAVVKSVATTLAYISVCATVLLDILHMSEPAAWKLYKRLNDPSDVFLLKPSIGEKSLFKPIPRSYIFSKTDEMILWDDIVGHARVAREELQAANVAEGDIDQAINLEEFLGTAHVNHIKSEGERYWNIIRETWTKTEQV